MTPHRLPFLLLLTSACMTAPQRVGARPTDYIAENRPARAWVQLTDDSEIMLEGPLVVSDTLFGTSGGQVVAFAPDQLKGIKVRRVSAIRTAIIPGILLAGTVAAVALTKSTDATIDPWNGNSHDDDNSPQTPIP